MADNILNNSLIDLGKIVNSSFERNLSQLDNLISKRDAALKSGNYKYAEYISSYIDRLTDCINKQTDAAQSFYDDMASRYEQAGIAENLNQETLKEIYEWMVKYSTLSEKKKEFEDNKVRIENELRKPNADAAGLNAEKGNVENSINKLDNEIRKLNQNIERKYGQGTIGRRAIDDFRSGGGGSDKLRDAIEAGRIANNNKEEERRLAQVRRVEEESIKRTKDMWNAAAKSWYSLWTDVKKVGNVWLDFNERAISDAKRLGIVTKEGALAHTESLLEKTQQLSRNFAMTAEEARKMQDSFMNATGRAIILSKEQMEDIAAPIKLLGQETVMSAIDAMDKMGMTSQTAVELLDGTLARAKNAGLDIKQTSEIFAKNLSMANKLNFKDGIDGVSRMVVYSQKLRMNMESVANVAERFYNIEDAIENTAKLQVLGGAGAMYGSNPMEWVYEANADPEAMQKRVAKIFEGEATFSRETGQATIPAFQQALIRERAKAMGLSPEEAINLAKRQSEIREVESDLRRYTPQFYNKLSQDQKDSIINKAYYDKETKSFYVNYRDEKGEEQKAKITEVSKLTEAEFKSISEQIDPIDDIRENVRKIAQELVGTRERWNSMKEQLSMGFARAISWPMEKIDGILTWINSSKLWNALTTIPALAGTYFIGKAAIKGGYSYLMSKTGGFSNILHNLLRRGKVTQTQVPSQGGGFLNAVGRFSRGVVNVGKNIVSSIGSFGKGIASSLGKFGRGIVSSFGKFGSAISRFGSGAVSAVGRFSRGVVNVGKNALNGIGRVGSNLLSRLGNIGSGIAAGGQTATGSTGLSIGSKLKGVGKIAGSAAIVATSVLEGYLEYRRKDKEAEERFKNTSGSIDLIEGNKERFDVGRRKNFYNASEIASMRVHAANRKNIEKTAATYSGVGQALGAAGGAFAGMAAGAKIGAAMGSAGGPVGILAGVVLGATIGAAGGYYGSKIGDKIGRSTASTQEYSVINKHLDEIQKGDEEENIRKIVLPVESIDYNVSLIANQLGIISARPAMGNVYLDVETEAVKRGQNPVEIGNSIFDYHMQNGTVEGVQAEPNVVNNMANGGNNTIAYNIINIPSKSSVSKVENGGNNTIAYNTISIPSKSSVSKVENGGNNTIAYNTISIPSKSSISKVENGGNSLFEYHESNYSEGNSTTKVDDSSNTNILNNDGGESLTNNNAIKTNVYHNSKTLANASDVKNITSTVNAPYSYPEDVVIDSERNGKIVNSTIRKDVNTERVYSNQTSSMNLNLSGSIDLTWKGMNVDKIDSNDIIKVLNSNPHLKSELANMIMDEFVTRGGGGRGMFESSWYNIGSGPGYGSLSLPGTTKLNNV